MTAQLSSAVASSAVVAVVAAPGPVPAVIIGGYLGAGKTTLVNHLLRHADGRRIAVLVNDFGEVSIDADLIVGAEGGVLSLAGGCVCCSFGGDLVGTLVEMLQRQPRPDVLLIETSGVGIPSAVARAVALAPGVRVEATVVVADAPTLRERAADRYVGDTVRQQLDDADLLLLNQMDRVDTATAAALQAWWATAHPRAPLWPTVRAQVPVEVVLGLRLSDDTTPGGAGRLNATAPGMLAPRPIAAVPTLMPALMSADQVYESGCLRLSGPVDVEALLAEWAASAGRVVRAKGIVQDLCGELVSVQWAGRQGHVEPWAAPVDPQRLGLVAWIGLKRQPDMA